MRLKKNHFIFDLYGTLVDIHTDEEKASLWDAMAAWFKEAGAMYTPEELKKTFRETVEKDESSVSAMHPEILYPEADMKRVFKSLFKNKDVEADKEMCFKTGQYFREQSTEYLRLYEGTMKLLEDLKKTGKVWLLSNAQEIFTLPELDKLGLAAYFDGIFISSQYGCKKPDPMFFRQLLGKYDIPEEKAVMIGNDGTSDIQGAKNLGISTVYLHSDLSPDEPLPEADIVLEINEIEKLSGLLTMPD